MSKRKVAGDRLVDVPDTRCPECGSELVEVTCTCSRSHPVAST